MTYTRSFPQLSLAVQQLGQWENSVDITPSVLLQAINYGLLQAYDQMVQKWADYYTVDVTFPLIAGTSSYPLGYVTGGNFFKLRHLDWTTDSVVTDSSRFYPMLPHEIEAAHTWTGRSASSGTPPRYRLQGNSIVLVPTPIGGTVRMYYIPLAPQIVDVNDTQDLQFEVPVEELLVVHYAQRDLIDRSDLDTSSVDRKIAMLIPQLRTAADSRDAGEPMYLDPRGPRRDRMRGGHDDEGWF